MKLFKCAALLALLMPFVASATCYDNTRACHIETAKGYLAISRGELEIYVNLGYPELLERHLKEKGLSPEEVDTTHLEIQQLVRKAVRVGLEQDLRTCREGGLPTPSTHRMKDIEEYGFTFLELQTTETEVFRCDEKVRHLHERIDQFFKKLKENSGGGKSI